MQKKFLGLVLISLILLVLSGCGGGGSKVTVKLNETFSAYNASDWDAIGVSTWSISTDSGNPVLQHTAGNSWLIYKNYIGNDYTVSVRIKPSATDAFCGILARSVDPTNFYSLTIDGGSPSNLKLRKFVDGGDNYPSPDGIATFIVLNTSNYYTLTLKVKGTTITGKITDGTNTATLSYNDNANFNGAPAFTSGKAGLFDMSLSMNTIFDDLKITEP